MCSCWMAERSSAALLGIMQTAAGAEVTSTMAEEGSGVTTGVATEAGGSQRCNSPRPVHREVPDLFCCAKSGTIVVHYTETVHVQEVLLFNSFKNILHASPQQHAHVA